MSSSAPLLRRGLGAWGLAALLALGMSDAVARGAEPAQDGHGLLFRIDAPGKPPSWVFGTIHLNDSRITAIPAPVMAALASSRRLAPEVVLSRDDMPVFFAATAQQEDGRRLSDHFDPDALERMRAAIGPAAPAAAALDRLKPWVVWLMLDRGGTISSAPSLDESLIVEARARRMTVFGLELPEEQVASLDALPMATQVALLRRAVASRHRVEADREAMIEAWLARDLRKLAALAEAPAKVDAALAPHLREVSKHLVENRNIVMAHRLFLPLRDGHVFVAVGALHLVGPGSLLALIRAQGYRVTRVY